MSKDPITWEEDERYQNGMARLISTLFVLWVLGYGSYCIWNHQLVELQWLAWVVGGLSAGFVAWSLLVLILARSGTLITKLMRNGNDDV